MKHEEKQCFTMKLNTMRQNKMLYKEMQFYPTMNIILKIALGSVPLPSGAGKIQAYYSKLHQLMSYSLQCVASHGITLFCLSRIMSSSTHFFFFILERKPLISKLESYRGRDPPTPLLCNRNLLN